MTRVGAPTNTAALLKLPKIHDTDRSAWAMWFAGHDVPDGGSARGPSFDDPPEWDPTVDAHNKLIPLHHWFAQALDLDAGMRFADAAAALEAFNSASATRPTPEEAIRGLEHFRSDFRSQRALASAYPAVGEVVETDRKEMWRSEFEGVHALVKMWKPGAWGDLRREAPRILAFLESAASLKVDRPAGLASILAAHWLGDAIVVVQEYIEGPTLASLIESRTGLGDSPTEILQFVRSLFVTVERLHEIDYAHGDLKPDNIVIAAEGGPMLIDPIDFAPAADGEISTSAYAPSLGNRFERDRFALLRIAEEILDGSRLDDEDARPLALAIETCRDKVPKLATLQPVMEAIDLVTNRIRDREAGEALGGGTRVTVCAVGAEAGPLSPDEGEFFVRYLDDRQRVRRTISLRGSIEELEIRLDRDGKPTSARRRNIDQRKISQISKYEFYKFKGEVIVERSDVNEFSGLAPLMAVAEVSDRLAVSESASGQRRSALDQTLNSSC